MDQSRRSQVSRWHSAFRLPVGTSKFEDPEYKMRRARLIAEECAEALSALLGQRICIFKGSIYSEPLALAGSEESSPDPVEFFDGLLDLEFVCEGSAVELGWDTEGGFAEVTRSNMTKLGADGKPFVDENGKVRKGPAFEPPKLERFM